MKTKRKTPAIHRYSPDLTPPATDNQESAINEHSAANDHLVITGFCGLGIPADDIKPRENVLTFGKWLKAGRSVKRGEHGIRIKARNGHITVFHLSQTEPVKAKSQIKSTKLPEAPVNHPRSSTLNPQPEPAARRLPAWLTSKTSALQPA